MLSRTGVTTLVALLGALGLACGDSRTLATSENRVISECTECHGGGDNSTGAPPLDISGRSDPSLPSVGAHTVHVEAGYDCSTCHPKPATVRAARHMDGTVQITFGAFATGNGTLSAGYSRSTHGCSATYCHGGFAGGNGPGAPVPFVPVWTAGAPGGACGTCHGSPGATASALPHTHPALALGSTNATCRACHPATVRADGTIDVAGGRHIDGTIDTDPAARHPLGWMDQASADFHGDAAFSDSSPCFRCHAWEAPAAVTPVTCWACHQFIVNPTP